jgi:hypothetical protein
MSVANDRETRARDAIRRAFGTDSGEGSINLFIEHHLEELPRSYWQQQLGSGAPEPATIVSLLQLKSAWGKGDIEYFDFTLPGEVTNYVVSVRFDDAGSVDEISMES